MLLLKRPRRRRHCWCENRSRHMQIPEGICNPPTIHHLHQATRLRTRVRACGPNRFTSEMKRLISRATGSGGDFQDISCSHGDEYRPLLRHPRCSDLWQDGCIKECKDHSPAAKPCFCLILPYSFLVPRFLLMAIPRRMHRISSDLRS